MNIFSQQIGMGQDIFLTAVEMPVNKQQKYILNACQGNAQLESYVLKLLESHQSSEEYFNELEHSITTNQLNEIENHLYRDLDFGNYQIINVLKQGGMGTIFLAKRSDGEFERDVVIKMISIDLNFKQSQNQFAHEKEILASLVHPNIVQLYDSGITKTGQSYFVMELVKGKTLLEYCNHNQLNIKRRLKLFQEVLDAIGFAHQHLVIHGDIKPSNIMVNDDGQIRLLDFGIAKLIYNNNEKTKGYSLNYLTPEHKNKQPIITTTDIHQLGQLLFELVTNIHPKDARDSEFSFPLLSKTTEDLNVSKINSLTGCFNLNMRSLTKLYHSDLQYIVEKSLAINPKDRYHSTQKFSDDLTLFKNKYCISAIEPTLRYKTSKYINRNLLLTTFISSLIVASIAFAIMTNKHNVNLAKERDKALKVKNLISEIFNAADPSFSPGKELTATEVLDIGLKRVREKLKGQKDIEADLLQEIAQTYQNLGQYKKTQSILQEIYDIRLKQSPNNHMLMAKSMLLIGENSRLMSNNKQAKIWLTQSLKIVEKDKDNKNLLASVQSKLGRVLVLLGELEQAENILSKSTQLISEIYGKNTLEYAQALNDLSSIYFRQGKYELVQKQLLNSKNISEKILPNTSGFILDKDYATNINNLGLAYYLQGKLIEGEKYFKQAINLRSLIFSKPHPDQAQSLNNLGLLLNDAGRSSEALPLLKQALEIRQSTLNKNHSRIFDAWNNLAMVYHENRDFTKAEEIYQRILKQVIKIKGEKKPLALSIMTNRGNNLLEMGKYQKAFDLFNLSLTIRKKLLPWDHIYLSYSYLGLGRANTLLGKIENGKSLIIKAINIREKKLPNTSWLVAEAFYYKAEIDFILGELNYDNLKKTCESLIQVKTKNSTISKKCISLINSNQN